MSAPFPGPSASAEPSHPLAPLSGRRVVVAGLISGAGGLAVALLLRAIVTNTPVRVSS